MELQYLNEGLLCEPDHLEELHTAWRLNGEAVLPNNLLQDERQFDLKMKTRGGKLQYMVERRSPLMTLHCHALYLPWYGKNIPQEETEQPPIRIFPARDVTVPRKREKKSKKVDLYWLVPRSPRISKKGIRF